MRCALPVTALVLVAAGSFTSASPMEDPSLGGAVFSGPTHGHASSFFTNPAALGLTGKGWHLHFGTSARLDRLAIKRTQTAINPPQEPSESIQSQTLSPGGIIAWYASFLDGKARFGVSFFTPTSQRFPSGESAIGYHSRGGQLVQSMATLAGSHQWGPLLVGLGFSLSYSSLRLAYNRDSVLTGGSDNQTGINSDCAGTPCGYENPEAREFYDINVGNQSTLSGLFSIKNISISTGVAYQFAHRSWISLSYVALPGAFQTLKLPGSVDITRAPRDGGQTIRNTPAEVTLGMAQMATLGFRRPAFSVFDMVMDLRWQDWSRHARFDIRLFGNNLDANIPEWMPRNRDMKDVWRFSGGLESNDQELYRFGARVRLETAATDTQNISPIQVTSANIAIAVGTELRLANQWVVGLGYDLSLFPTIAVIDSAFSAANQVQCVDAAYEYSQCAAVRDGRAYSSAAGTYSHLQHGLVLSIRYDSL